jgi:hypothetical protein
MSTLSGVNVDGRPRAADIAARVATQSRELSHSTQYPATYSDCSQYPCAPLRIATNANDPVKTAFSQCLADQTMWRSFLANPLELRRKLYTSEQQEMTITHVANSAAIQ